MGTMHVINPEAYDESLTHCDLVASYGDRDLGQHWLR